jgi:hypothetical protein
LAQGNSRHLSIIACVYLETKRYVHQARRPTRISDSLPSFTRISDGHIFGRPDGGIPNALFFLTWDLERGISIAFPGGPERKALGSAAPGPFPPFSIRLNLRDDGETSFPSPIITIMIEISGFHVGRN